MRYASLSWFFFSLVATPLHAAFVLDDFDVPQSTSSPEMLGDAVSLDSIGPLQATREIRIAASASGPRSPLASLSIANGTMSTVLEKAGTTLNGTPASHAFQLNYMFDTPLDVSEAGTNNAIFIDFLSVIGNESPTSFGLLVGDESLRGTFFSDNRVPFATGPETLVIPFTHFTFRDGTPGLPDFGTFRRMAFDFFFQRPRLDIEWSAQIDQIRFGRIPEPSSWLLWTVAITCISRRVFRSVVCKRRSCDVNSKSEVCERDSTTISDLASGGRSRGRTQ